MGSTIHQAEIQLPTWNLSEYGKLINAQFACLKLLPHLLETVSYSFGSQSAQVVALVFHRTASESAELMDNIISLGRLMNYLVALV